MKSQNKITRLTIYALQQFKVVVYVDKRTRNLCYNKCTNMIKYKQLVFAHAQWYSLNNNIPPHRARGAMDNASAYGAEDSRFESWRARNFIFVSIYSLHVYFTTLLILFCKCY